MAVLQHLQEAIVAVEMGIADLEVGRAVVAHLHHLVELPGVPPSQFERLCR